MIPSDIRLMYNREGQNTSGIMWYVYMLKCSDGSFYTGITAKIKERVHRHNKGRASKYTKARLPVELLYAESFSMKSDARAREIQIKDFSCDNKAKLIKFGMGHRFPSAQKV